MDGYRKNTSRSLELLAIAANIGTMTPDPEAIHLMQAFKASPAGGVYESTTGTTVHWGNIERLLDGLNQYLIPEVLGLLPDLRLPRTVAPRFIVHLDSMKAGTKMGERDEVQLAVSRVKGKADILIAEANGMREVSFKDSSASENKLWQQSKSESYVFSGFPATLNGGLNFPELKDQLFTLKSRVVVNSPPKSLSPDQWSRLKNEQYRILAVVKESFPTEWKDFVRLALGQAGKELDTMLGMAFPSDSPSHGRNLAAILSRGLIAGETPGHEEWILYMDGSARLDRAMEQLRHEPGVEVQWSRKLSQSGKPSWFVHALVSNRRYLVTKIEPSFDGARPNVSQTKGVIYYFQEGSRYKEPGERSVWNLLADLSAKS
jgi:hypothetical protein